MQLVRSIALVLALVMVTAACQTASGRSAGRTVDDASITAAVKSKLVADRTANLTRVDVDTTNGVVNLSGSVDTAEQRARAEKLAREAKGVNQVVNKLQVSRQ